MSITEPHVGGPDQENIYQLTDAITLTPLYFTLPCSLTFWSTLLCSTNDDSTALISVLLALLLTGVDPWSKSHFLFLNYFLFSSYPIALLCALFLSLIPSVSLAVNMDITATIHLDFIWSPKKVLSNVLASVWIYACSQSWTSILGDIIINQYDQ